MRVAFVGQEMYYGSCAMPHAAGGIEPAFVDHRGGADAAPMIARLHALAPDVVVVFRPEIVPPGAFAELDALTLGFNTEPLPRDPGAGADRLFRLSELAQTDVTQFDRILTFDPLSADAAQAHGIDVWRSLPLPVDDRFFAPVTRAQHPPRVTFVGYSSEHRERWLVDAKHHFDVLHVAWGLHGDALRGLFARTDVALNVHGEPYPSFENRVCLHLAAGHLVVSEPLSPLHGLEPGIDFLEVSSPGRLLDVIAGVRSAPDLHASMRRRGRRKAEQFRASRVWPRILGDLVADVKAFGGRAERRAIAPPLAP